MQTTQKDANDPCVRLGPVPIHAGANEAGTKPVSPLPPNSPMAVQVVASSNDAKREHNVGTSSAPDIKFAVMPVVEFVLHLVEVATRNAACEGMRHYEGTVLFMPPKEAFQRFIRLQYQTLRETNFTI